MANIDREPCGERGTAEERERDEKGGNEEERKQTVGGGLDGVKRR
jgi:hypothetical protein